MDNDGTANTNRAVQDSDTDMQGDMFLDSSEVHFCAVEGGYSIAMCDGRLKEEKELLRKL